MVLELQQVHEFWILLEECLVEEAIALLSREALLVLVVDFSLYEEKAASDDEFGHFFLRFIDLDIASFDESREVMIFV